MIGIGIIFNDSIGFNVVPTIHFSLRYVVLYYITQARRLRLPRGLGGRPLRVETNRKKSGIGHHRRGPARDRRIPERGRNHWHRGGPDFGPVPAGVSGQLRGPNKGTGHSGHVESTLQRIW